MSFLEQPIADVLLEESLDELDPLRHLRNDHPDNSAALLPPQPPSVHHQHIFLDFPVPGPLDPLRIHLHVDASPGCGGIAWPAGEVLASYISLKTSLSGKTVLELGSGTGLVGLAAAILGADVWITDQAPLLQIMARNVALNGLSDRVHVSELNWGEPVPHDIPKVDIVLAADCVYYEPAFPLLVKTLCDLASQHNPEFLFCYKKRRKADKRFFTLLKRDFTWSDVSDDPNRLVYSRDAISLLRLVWKRQ